MDDDAIVFWIVAVAVVVYVCLEMLGKFVFECYVKFCGHAAATESSDIRQDGLRTFPQC